MKQQRFLTALVCLAFLTGSAAAHSIDKRGPHERPTGSAPSLQQILDGLVVSGPAIDADAPDNNELWQNSAGPLTASIAADYTSRKDRIKFGIYDSDHPDNPAFLLSNRMRPSDIATVSFNDDGSISIRGGLQREAFGFDGPFGFLVEDSAKDDHGSSVFLFTEADLNGGSVRVKVFQGDNSTVLKLPGQQPGVFLDSQFLIAFETRAGCKKNGGFNFVVFVSGIVPTAPEPATLGLLAVLFARRARSG